jgi:hypothetical protein
LDALEDSLWEANYSSFLHEEYLRLKISASYVQYFSKYFIPYNISNRQFTPKFDILNKPLKVDPTKFTVFSVYSDNFFLKPDLLNLTSFTYFNNILNAELAEDSYENFKSLSLLYNNSFKFLNAAKVNFTPVVSYATNANLFRADFDEAN